MGRVVHFEIQADDVARAKEFYSEVFGWKIEKQSAEYWSIATGKADAPDTDDAMSKWGGIDGGLVARKGARPTHDNPVSAYVCTIQVVDIDETVVRVLKHAGNVMVEKYTVDGLGEVCYCADTEGNSFCLLQAADESTHSE